ncbi:glucosamine-6-phosphate deaminase [Austwickia chelonae]|uniref:Glucosamine-6-phosphate deaminase n=1 Tax=Austwickia chelonae NBRC 105200 TaxID=1184607 RepID=K6V599_9MICO|nr:glucosamine-6-phosphate deaminase [Austwickia chelonae]GAB77388.1 glucosamine-6-phosphate deaminase [Austwickia chelonae NBRC 105200]SEW09344.1 glucosamine-6-phosphate deaminase [Austwickia chelonae]
MEVVVCRDAEEPGRHAAEAIEVLLAEKPTAVLGVATGSSPLTVYAELGRRVGSGQLSLATATAFMLDEYVGLPRTHPERYRNVIEREFVARVDIDPARVHGPDGAAADLPAACRSYEQAIREAGGVDLQLLGIGTDGHIAFNEPGSSLTSRTRIKTLTGQTRRDNARFFEGDIEKVPKHCLTQGIGTIMEAKHLVLLASGRAKAEAVHQMVEGPISAMWPATILQMHPHVTVLLDEAAAYRLQLASYYAEAYQAKPDWQHF